MVSYKRFQFRSGLIFCLTQIHLDAICVYGSKTELSCSAFMCRMAEDGGEALNEFTASMLGIFFPDEQRIRLKTCTFSDLKIYTQD